MYITAWAEWASHSGEGPDLRLAPENPQQNRSYLPRALSCPVMAPLQLCPAAGLYPNYALAQPHSHTQQPQGLILAQTCGSTSQLVTDLSHHYIIALQCGLLVGPGHHFQVRPAPRLTNESTCEKMKGRKSRE